MATSTTFCSHDATPSCDTCPADRSTRANAGSGDHSRSRHLRKGPATPLRRALPAAASSLSAVSCWVEVLELDAGVPGREPPVDPATGPVAGRLPRRDLPFQGRLIGQAAVQALLGQHGQLDLGHGQPAALLGGGVDL
jgi:hypothetical protein